LKYYGDELDATTKAGMLDSPAIINTNIMETRTAYPIFTTLAANGKMLVTENPAYMKNNVAKYIPQFMVYKMWPCGYPAEPSLDAYNIIEKDFPIERFQTMIR
jgi:hypothetical protein